MLEKTLENPLDCKDIQPVHPNGDQSWVFTGRTGVEAEAPILWLPDAKNWLIWKDPDAGKDWGQEKGTTENKMVGWYHRLNGHGFGWTLRVADGQGGLVCCSSWGHKELDTTERLNWTDMQKLGEYQGLYAEGETNLKRLHAVWFHLYGILKMTKLYSWRIVKLELDGEYNMVLGNNLREFLYGNIWFCIPVGLTDKAIKSIAKKIRHPSLACAEPFPKGSHFLITCSLFIIHLLLTGYSLHLNAPYSPLGLEG